MAGEPKAHLRLVHSANAPDRPARQHRPALALISSNETPQPVREPGWRPPPVYAPCGRLIPPTGKWDRVRLDTQRATKAWRQLAKDLDAATDGVAAALEAGVGSTDMQAALDAYHSVVGKILTQSTCRLDDLRTRLALVAWTAGARNSIGSAFGCLANHTEAAFALLDHELFRLR